MLDVELTPHHVQELCDADAVASFFHRLRYKTESRLPQTPANLGITESLHSQIRRCELLADQEGFLQVYLLELKSVTVAAINGIARAFRNKVEQILLVVTADSASPSHYGRLDFILLERIVPEGKPGETGAPTQRQVSIHPRVLSVDRRKPTRRELRVLRRLSYTEVDPLAQYDKLLSAYTVADWTEEHFNNRALFSDYYLTSRLPDEPEWKEDCKPAYFACAELYRDARRKFANVGEDELRQSLLEPMFKTLGFDCKSQKEGREDKPVADYLMSPSSSLASFADSPPSIPCLTYCWGRMLDAKDYTRDSHTPDENPGAVVVSLLEQEGTEWAIVTNGKLWRLYSAKTHSRSTNYFEIDLEEVLAELGSEAADPEAFRYFWLLFRAEAFVTTKTQRHEDSKESLCFLDRLLQGSEAYAKQLGERLKGRAFEQIFPFFARGFIEHAQVNGGRARNPFPPDQTSERTLAERDFSPYDTDTREVFQATLTFLYRLLFVLYSEARDLLPVREQGGYAEHSLQRLKQEVAERAGTDIEQVTARLEKAYSKTETALYDRLTALFRIIDHGEPKLNVPTYNGGLFITASDASDGSDETRNAAFLATHKIPDFYLAVGLDLLARDEDDKTKALVFIDYKSLGVRQLGSIYEGLLEFRVRIAPEKMAVVKGKKTEEVVAYTEAVKEERAIVKVGRGKNAAEKTIPKGAVYLENDRRERKATGSYYTPDYIVQYIITHTVGPVLKEKFERLTPRLREAQKAYRQQVKNNEAYRKSGQTALVKDPEVVALGFQDVVDGLFDVKVLDPAMGSGHFLVEAVDFITDKTIDFLNGFPWNPVTATLAKTREAILGEMRDRGIALNPGRLTDINLLKRHVLKRCIYGVDLNPMAVELAKVSLWLDCFTLGAPLSFLDHHLKCGNSLIGAKVAEVRQAIGESTVKGHTQMDLFGSPFAGLLNATEIMRRVGELSDVTPDMVQQSRREYRKAADSLAPFKRILDVYVSQWFGNGAAALDFLKSDEAQEFVSGGREGEAPAEPSSPVARTALAAANDKRFFHWELEFPEVWYGAGQEKENPGFDAVVGNPPYDVLSSEELGYDVSLDVSFYETCALYEPAIRGKKNLYKLFTCRGLHVTNDSGMFSFIVPMALLGDDQAAGVRQALLQEANLVAVESFPQKDDPDNRVFLEAKLSTAIFVASMKTTDRPVAVRGHPGRLIENTSSICHVSLDRLVEYDSHNVPILTCTQRDLDIVAKIASNECIVRLGKYCRAFQGEVNETTDGKRGFISTNESDGPPILRGSTICLYAVREASQGEAIYLKQREYLNGKPDSVKARHHEQRRVGWQESSPQNNFRRIIAAWIPKGEFCNHKINYIPETECELSLDFVLALLNSQVCDWYFRLGSTNAAVSHYQIYNLPAPSLVAGKWPSGHKELLEGNNWVTLGAALASQCTEPGIMPKEVMEALAEMSRRIQAIEARRVLSSRSERSQLAPESQLTQDVIDTVLFRCYGLTDDEAGYIRERLKEML